MYPYHVFNLEPAGTFGIYPICYWQVSGGHIQPEPAMYSRCFRWFPGPLTPSVNLILGDSHAKSTADNPFGPPIQLMDATRTVQIQHCVLLW